jgi:hypothetical protein
LQPNPADLHPNGHDRDLNHLGGLRGLKATFPEGDVAQPPQIDERIGVRFLVDRKTLD